MQNFISIFINTSVLIGILLLGSEPLLSQFEPCGTETVDFANYDDLKNNDEIETRDEYTMPIMLHIITENNGNYEVNVDDVLDEIRISSSYFETHGIELKLCDIKYTENSNLYDFDKSNDFPDLALLNEINVLNLYIVESLINESGDQICGTAFYPWSNYDIVVVENSCATNRSTIAHEIGHYLGLYHTHDYRFGYELVDQSNCDSAGDRICDTPADPRLSSSNLNTSCTYIGTDTDNNGDLYRPDPELLMSYSKKHCRTKFTDEQANVMRNVCDLYYPNYACEYDITSSITESDAITITVFPNPVTDILYLRTNFKMDCTSTIYNLQGIAIQHWANKTKLNVENLPEGIYLLEIKDIKIGHSSIQRIIISK